LLIQLRQHLITRLQSVLVVLAQLVQDQMGLTAYLLLLHQLAAATLVALMRQTAQAVAQVAAVAVEILLSHLQADQEHRAKAKAVALDFHLPSQIRRVAAVVVLVLVAVAQVQQLLVMAATAQHHLSADHQ
jgi:hypothetical protein